MPGKKLTEEEKNRLIQAIRAIHNGGSKETTLREAIKRANVNLHTNTSAIYRYFPLAFPESNEAQASPLDQIHAAERQIKSALLELDNERNRLMQQIKEIDDLAAKYRHSGVVQ